MLRARPAAMRNRQRNVVDLLSRLAVSTRADTVCSTALLGVRGRRRRLTRRAILMGATGSLLAAQLSEAQQAVRKVPRIGYVAGGPLPFVEGFRRGLRELGYVEGRDVIVE